MPLCAREAWLVRPIVLLWLTTLAAIDACQAHLGRMELPTSPGLLVRSEVDKLDCRSPLQARIDRKCGQNLDN